MTRHKTRRLLPGLLWLVLWSAPAWAEAEDWPRYMHAGYEAHQAGDYAEALKQLKTAVEHAERFGPRDWRLAPSLNALAFVYHDLGRYADAERLYRRALAIRKKLLGPEHSDVAQSLNNLAVLYHEQGRYAEAEPFYQRALAIWQKALAPEHPYVALSLENYGTLLRETGRGAEAIELKARARHGERN